MPCLLVFCLAFLLFKLKEPILENTDTATLAGIAIGNMKRVFNLLEEEEDSMAKSVYVSSVLARHLLWMKRNNNISVHNDCGFTNHHLHISLSRQMMLLLQRVVKHVRDVMNFGIK